MNEGTPLRIFGCALASIISFLVCMLIVSQLFGPAVVDGSGSVWGTLVSLGVAGAFGWAFWRWPARKHQP
jgi:hypothetical protein